MSNNKIIKTVTFRMILCPLVIIAFTYGVSIQFNLFHSKQFIVHEQERI